MTTAADIVQDAALAAGVGDMYNALDSTQSALGLRVLNRLLDTWSNESLMIFNQSESSFPMTAGVPAYSTSLLVPAARPVEITHCFVRQSNIDYPVEIIGDNDYARIATKSIGGLPTKMYYDAGVPNSTMTFYPVPSTPYTAFLGYRAQLGNLSSLQTAISLPPGYENALVYGLATLMAPMFGRDPTPTCIYHAKASKQKLKAVNYVANEVELGLPLGRGLFNIFQGS